MKHITIVITSREEDIDNASLLQDLAAVINEATCASLNRGNANWSTDTSQIKITERKANSNCDL